MFSFHEFWLPWGIEQDIFSYGKWEGIFKACAAVQGSEIGSNMSCSGWFLFGSLLNVCRWIQQQPFYLILRGKADDSWLFSHFDFVIWKKKLHSWNINLTIFQIMKLVKHTYPIFLYRSQQCHSENIWYVRDIFVF